MADTCVSVPSAGFTSKNSEAIEIVHISAAIRPEAIVKALMSWSPRVTTSTSPTDGSMRQIWCVASIGAMNQRRSLPSQTTFMAL